MQSKTVVCVGMGENGSSTALQEEKRDTLHFLDLRLRLYVTIQ